VKEIVVQGVVEVMNERQIAERQAGLSRALGRLSRVRSQRTGTMPAAFERAVDVLEPVHERSLFGFGDRARNAISGPLED
jgi:hypothetical protein